MVQMRCRLLLTAAALALLALAQPGLAGAEAADPGDLGPSQLRAVLAPAPVPTPWPPVIQVFDDDFESRITYAKYTGIGGANVYIANGRLTVDVPPGAPPDSAGLRMRLPANGTGVRCSAFRELKIPNLGTGQMHWTLFGFDDVTGAEVVLIEMFITESTGKQDPFLSFRYEKNGRGVYAHVKTNQTADKIKKIQWDTKNGGKRVQAEITFCDGSKASSPWIDPEASTIAGFDLTTDAPEFSAGGTEGAEVHAQGEAVPTDPAPIEPFASPTLTALYPYWLVQAHDADAVLVATVARVGSVRQMSFEEDQRPRLEVHYFLDEALYGSPGADRFTVFHALDGGQAVKHLRPGTRLLLFVKNSEQGLWDFGQPTGVIPGQYQNYQAVASRVDLIHGRSAP